MRTASIMLAVLALAAVLAGCSDQGVQPDFPDSEEPETPVDEATVDQVLKNPAAYDGAPVVVRNGKFVPIEPSGAFVLQGEEGRILVYAPGGIPRELKKGESVGIRGEVVRFTEAGAEALGEEFADAEALADTPTERGDPYLLLRSVAESGADANVPEGG